MDSIGYYNKNSKSFYYRTVNADVQDLYQKFLLHVPKQGVIEGFHKSLLPSGILYTSFKYGTSMTRAEDRIFFDMDETTIEPYLKELFVPLEIWKSADTCSAIAPSSDKSWLNFIARRI